jgi:hypothetical protein
MIKSSIEKLAGEIGFDIGNSDDTVQADLLNGLCKGLANSMQPHQLETQLCYIVNRLDPKAMEVIKNICEFIKLKEK